MTLTNRHIMNFFSVMRRLLLLALLLLVSACMIRAPITVIDKAPEAATATLKAQNVRQALLVIDNRNFFTAGSKVYALERIKTDWRQALEPMNAVIGKNGFAMPGEKREGDGRTPSGRYRLGTIFGYEPSVATRMPYRQAGEDDLWVDDPQSPDYNRWVKWGQTKAASFEKMKRDDDLYKYGIVIEYNTDPVVSGHGSAIFLHIWPNERSTTAGCVAVSEADLLKILAWLDPAANPVILINPDSLPKGETADEF